MSSLFIYNSTTDKRLSKPRHRSKTMNQQQGFYSENQRNQKTTAKLGKRNRKKYFQCLNNQYFFPTERNENGNTIAAACVFQADTCTLKKTFHLKKMYSQRTQRRKNHRANARRKKKLLSLPAPPPHVREPLLRNGFSIGLEGWGLWLSNRPIAPQGRLVFLLLTVLAVIISWLFFLLSLFHRTILDDFRCVPVCRPFAAQG